MKDIQKVLRTNNLRMTPIRKKLIEILKRSDKPLTAPELLIELSEEGFEPNKTTLYRQLDTLINISVVQSVHLYSGVTHYELQTHHHHHFICKKCAKVECIEDEKLENAIDELENTMRNKRGNVIHSHELYLTGLCGTCTSL